MSSQLVWNNSVHYLSLQNNQLTEEEKRLLCQLVDGKVPEKWNEFVQASPSHSPVMYMLHEDHFKFVGMLEAAIDEDWALSLPTEMDNVSVKAHIIINYSD